MRRVSYDIGYTSDCQKSRQFADFFVIVELEKMFTQVIVTDCEYPIDFSGYDMENLTISIPETLFHTTKDDIISLSFYRRVYDLCICRHIG